jgi:phenylacetate-coenzyme A ligase PaaK-like adenylate-forming protein
VNTAEPASLSAELASLARWVPTGDAAHLHWFRELIVNEFLSFDEQHAREAQALRATVSFAAMQVPYYRRLFSQLSLSSTEIGAREDLTKLPILSKEDLIVHAPIWSLNRYLMVKTPAPMRVHRAAPVARSKW